MKRASIGMDLVGKRVAAELRIASRDPDVLYQLRFPEGKKLTAGDIRRLREADIEYICVNEDSTVTREDIKTYLYSSEMRDVHQETVKILDQFANQIIPDNSFKTKEHRNLEALQGQVQKLIGTIRNTDYLYSYSLLRAHHDYAGRHSFEVCKHAIDFAINRHDFFEEKFEEEIEDRLTTSDPIQEFGLAALLHDLGRWAVDQEVLEKSTRLNEEEWQEVENHPIEGYNILEELKDPVSDPIKFGALDHHESFDGTGYPLKKRGESIHLFGRILRVIDVYSALTSNRPYSVAVSPNRAKQKMGYMVKSGNQEFDPEILSEFFDLKPPFPIGQNVVLDDGSSAVVIDYEREEWDRPVVRITHPASETFSENDEMRVNVPDAPSIVN